MLERAQLITFFGLGLFFGCLYFFYFMISEMMTGEYPPDATFARRVSLYVCSLLMAS